MTKKQLKPDNKAQFIVKRVGTENKEFKASDNMVKQCNNCKHWRLGTASLDDNYCNLTGEWSDYEGYCDNWGAYLND